MAGDYNGDGWSHRLDRPSAACGTCANCSRAVRDPGARGARDFDGNGTLDIAIYRPANGMCSGNQFGVQFGHTATSRGARRGTTSTDVELLPPAEK